jgi:hypothetical protein
MSKQNELAQLADVVTVDGSNVGIGTSSPSRQLHISGSTPIIRLTDTDTNAYGEISSSSSDGNLMFFADQGNTQANTTIRFYVDASEQMRIDSSNRLLVGMSSSSATAAGFRVIPNDFMSFTTTSSDAGDRALLLNRQSSDGILLEFKKANSAVGSIGNSGNYMYLASLGPSARGVKITDNFIPATTSGANNDNVMDLGGASVRWDDVYATNGTIQTSDFNEKQDIASLTATEMLVGKRISALFKTFRWKDSVAENGDNARTHAGVIAQDVQAAFTAEGLDAGDYALFISSTWWETQTDVPAVEAVAEVLDEDGNVTTEAVEAVDAYTRTDTYDTEAEAPEGATSKTRLGIRYPELLSFVAAYNEQRFASIEARLTALEA